MTIFWIGIAVLSALALLTIWLPFFRRNRAVAANTDAQLRKQTNLALFKERLAELERDQQEGRINEQEFAEMQQELQLNLLQNTEQEDDALSVSKPSPIWPVAMSVVLLAVSGYTYYDLGRYNDWDSATAEQPASPHAGMTPEQMQAMRLMQMEQAVEAQPGNSQAWFSLGYAYITASQYDKAVKAFDTVMELVGQHADILGPKATAMYYGVGQQITPEVQAVIDQALADDSKDLATRRLLAMDAFYSGNYQNAIEHLEIMLTNPRQDVDREGIMSAIEQAKMAMQQGAITQ